MKDKKPIFYVILISLLILIAITPAIALDFNVENKVSNEKIKNQNNIVVAKAGVDDISANDSDNSTQCNNDYCKAPKKLSQSQILKASVYVNNYVAKNKKLPNKVSIGSYDFSMPEYTYLISKTINYKQNNKKTDVIVKYGLKNPPKPTGTKVKGKLNYKFYYKYAKNLSTYIENNNRIPNYVNTKIGKMQYQTAVYGFNRILYWSYTHKDKMPSSISLNIAKNHKMNKVIPQHTSIHGSCILQEANSHSLTKNFIILLSNYSCGPTKIMYNIDSLISVGKCSCGKAGDYHYHEASFKNYCPYCKVYGIMIYKEGSKCPEGMWVCSKCEADFCLVTGKEHIVKSPKYLTATN